MGYVSPTDTPFLNRQDTQFCQFPGLHGTAPPRDAGGKRGAAGRAAVPGSIVSEALQWHGDTTGKP